MGIDPGLGGALAFIFDDAPGRVETHDAPTVDGEIDCHALAELIRSREPRVCVVERVGPMPRDGARQAFAFGAAYATAKAAVGLSGIPMRLVTPAEWKRALRLPGGPEGKEAARALAIQTFPLSASSFSRKLDHNRAEAALLAIWLTRHAPPGAVAA